MPGRPDGMGLTGLSRSVTMSDRLSIGHSYGAQVATAETNNQVDRRGRRREAKRATILAEAWTLAHRDGLAAISLRDLGERVDLRQPSLYAYFDSKLGLYDLMFADGNRQLLDMRGVPLPERRPTRGARCVRRGAGAVLERGRGAPPAVVPADDPRLRTFPERLTSSLSSSTRSPAKGSPRQARPIPETSTSSAHW